MAFGTEKRISDICLLVEDIERTVRFYVDKLGFRLRRRAEGFADLTAPASRRAWELGPSTSTRASPACARPGRAQGLRGRPAR